MTGDPGLVEKLRRVPLFASLSDESLEALAGRVTEFEAPAGHVLIQPGQPGSGLFLLDEGTVVVERAHGDVERGAGEFVGELALIADDGLRTVRVRCQTAVRGLAIGRAVFSELLNSEPRIAVAMLPVLARRLAEAEK